MQGPHQVSQHLSATDRKWVLRLLPPQQIAPAIIRTGSTWSLSYQRGVCAYQLDVARVGTHVHVYMYMCSLSRQHACSRLHVLQVMCPAGRSPNTAPCMASQCTESRWIAQWSVNSDITLWWRSARCRCSSTALGCWVSDPYWTIHVAQVECKFLEWCMYKCTVVVTSNNCMSWTYM